MTKAVITPITPSAVARRLTTPPAILASLDACLVRSSCLLVVQFARPVDVGAPVMVDGLLIATMHARGAVHHHRIRVGDVLWLVPPVWLTSASRDAIAALPRALEPDLATRARAALADLMQECLA